MIDLRPRGTGPLRQARWRAAAAGLSLAGLALLAACGGGVEGGGTGTSPQGYGEGSVTALGDVVVNGVRYDATSARVVDDLGQPLATDTLRLGMVLRVDSGALDEDTLTASALQMTVAPTLAGPVSASDLTARTLQLGGQPVEIDPSTVFDPRLVGGQSAIAVGSELQVYAAYDVESSRYVARRIEPRSAPGPDLLQGRVEAFNRSTRSFGIGGQRFALALGAAIPEAMAEGAFLTVQFTRQPDALGRWPVQRVMATPARAVADGEVRLDGLIEQMPDATHLRVGGMLVDIGDATLAPEETLRLTDGLKTGLRVLIQGQGKAGVVKASALTVKPVKRSGDRENHQPFTLTGTLGVPDLATHTFVLHGMPVSFAGNVRYAQGTAADLVAGRRVQVIGPLSDDGTTLVAQDIAFDP